VKREVTPEFVNTSKEIFIPQIQGVTTPSATEVEEILKVMTESLPVKLSPLGPQLTKLFQKEKEPAKTKKAARPKKAKNHYSDRSHRRDTTRSFSSEGAGC
jgi:hypothetical protein